MTCLAAKHEMETLKLNMEHLKKDNEQLKISLGMFYVFILDFFAHVSPS